MATSNTSASTTPVNGTSAGGAAHLDASKKSVISALGLSHKRLNTNAGHLQDAIEDIRDDFLKIIALDVGGVRHDVMKNGLLGEIVARTPILVYDLPELKRVVNTAFVDHSGKMYISDTFAVRLVAEHAVGLDSANFLIRHEADHLRRMHLTRMLDMPASISNIAQDIRINIDLTKGEAAELLFEKLKREPTPAELIAGVSSYLDSLATTVLQGICAMTIDDHKKYEGLSEEAIGAILMKDWKDAPPMPNRDVSFTDIMEGAAQEADKVKGILITGAPKIPVTPPPNAMTPAELSGLAQDLRTIGQSKANPAKVTDADLSSAKDRLSQLFSHQGVAEMDAQHSKGSLATAGLGTVHASGKTGDAYLDALMPSQRVQAAMDILEQILNPKPGGPSIDSGGNISLKDLDRNMNSQPGDPSPPGPANSSQSTGDADTVPSPNVYHDHDHIMSTEKLVDILTQAGLSPESMEKLGYDDLDKLEGEAKATKDGLAGAINKASEDQMRVGSRYPGGHLLHHAKAQMIDFYKPVLTWEMSAKRLIEGTGRGSREAPEEPWSIYYADAVDMGFKSQNDVPYMGSRLPGKPEKPLIFFLIDTSGSVDDPLLKRFITEPLNMVRKISRGVAPDVAIVFADTVSRGDPVFITEKNYKQFLEKGIDYGGRGGTNFHASIENVFEMVSPNSRSGYAKRKLDALIYMTDTGDFPPDPVRLLKKAKECGLSKIPTTLFLAPKVCFNDQLNAGLKTWADIIYFDPTPGVRNVINMDKIADRQARLASP